MKESETKRRFYWVCAPLLIISGTILGMTGKDGTQESCGEESENGEEGDGFAAGSLLTDGEQEVRPDETNELVARFERLDIKGKTLVMAEVYRQSKRVESDASADEK